MIRSIGNNIAWGTLLGAIGWNVLPVLVSFFAQVMK